MTKPVDNSESLRARLRGAADADGLFLWDADRQASLSSLATGTYLRGQLEALRGKSILLATKNQLATALALIELDGIARRFVICPSDVAVEHLPSIISTAEIDALVTDRPIAEIQGQTAGIRVEPSLQPEPLERTPEASHVTEWILLTSGTTGVPKLVVHSLAGLTRAFSGRSQPTAGVIWATFYDIRRYGGLQMFLRAVTGPTSMVLSNADESPSDHLRRLAKHGVTHISGTPTHWRRAIMNPAARQFKPRYVRLSGEIADQAILDSLRTFWPDAPVGHAYASTEAGVGFEVVDGREGFPVDFLGRPRGDLEMKIEGDTLRIRSIGAATRYLGATAPVLVSDDGFVDTGDIIEVQGDRCYFRGRRGGVINVGGSKVHPEEVEAVINGHPRVRMSLVTSRKNPITGAIVVADVVLNAPAAEPDSETEREILELCRQHLPRHKVPAIMRFVPSLNVTGAGKLARGNA